MQIWINPDITGGETISDATGIGNTNEDPDPSRGIVEWRWRTRSNIGIRDLDEVRFGSSWESVLPSNVPPTTPIPATGVKAWRLYE